MHDCTSQGHTVLWWNTQATSHSGPVDGSGRITRLQSVQRDPLTMPVHSHGHPGPWVPSGLRGWHRTRRMGPPAQRRGPHCWGNEPLASRRHVRADPSTGQGDDRDMSRTLWDLDEAWTRTSPPHPGHWVAWTRPGRIRPPHVPFSPSGRVGDKRVPPASPLPPGVYIKC